MLKSPHSNASNIDIFFIGAGRPAHGHQPSALKKIAQDTRAIDWQLHSFSSSALSEFNPVFHYVGGYHVDEIMARYANLHFTVIPNWDKGSILETLLNAPFSGKPAIITYSDTIFRPQVITSLLSENADIVFGIDTQWEKRHTDTTEKMHLQGKTVKFTGLVYFRQPVVEYLMNADLLHGSLTQQERLPALIAWLENQGFSVKTVDVSNAWAELDFPRDLAQFILGTKAETLARLEPLVRESYIGKQVSFSVNAWQENTERYLDEIITTFSPQKLIIRSSSKDEDHWEGTAAGCFDSILNVDSTKSSLVKEAVERVIASYHVGENTGHQVLVQAFLEEVTLSGVVFTCGLETGAPYYRFNFDDTTTSTESVTSGTSSDHRTILLSRFHPETLEHVEPKLVPVLRAIQELEKLLGFDKLDIEFAIDTSGKTHLFQVRPITVNHSDYEVDEQYIVDKLTAAVNTLQSQQTPAPWIHGDKAIFGNMPDWNPAEIIGKHPKTLAFSLYRELITDDVWAQQRAEYGFRDVRPTPLLFAFAGQPYVDVRASLNSFIPATLPETIAKRLANGYLQHLSQHPSLHDKIEFDIAFTTWTPDFQCLAKKRLIPYGIKQDEIDALENALKTITCQAFKRLEDDTKSVDQLASRRDAILSSAQPKIDKIFGLLQDCRRFGTLAFAHAARAGFVAITLLKSLINTGELSKARYALFLKSIHTITGELGDAKIHHHAGRMSLAELIAQYGHLRPGTYEISTPAYWENPEHYLLSGDEALIEKPVFIWTDNELIAIQALLAELDMSITPQHCIEFFEKAIQARESVKCEFSRNLSVALDLLVAWGNDNDIARETLSWFSYEDIEQLKLNLVTVQEIMPRIEQRKEEYCVTTLVELPSLLYDLMDCYCFERHTAQPNFVTHCRIEAPLALLNNNDMTMALSDRIVLIPQADPGFDWLFGHGIAGLITKYGGANSHMTIRAAELGLPAAIGIGEKLYEQLASAHRIELDCANQIIRVIT